MSSYFMQKQQDKYKTGKRVDQAGQLLGWAAIFIAAFCIFRFSMAFVLLAGVLAGAGMFTPQKELNGRALVLVVVAFMLQLYV